MLKKFKLKMASLAAFATTIFWIALTSPAFAYESELSSRGDAGSASTTSVGGGGGISLGDVLCNAVANASAFAPLFSWIAYATGALAALRGAYYLRLHTEDPRGGKLQPALTLLGGAAALLALPGFVGMIASTFYNAYGTGSGGGSGISCVAGATSSAGGGLDVAVASFVANIKAPMLLVISIVAAACGLFFIVRGLIKASKYGFDSKTNSVHSILTHFLFGGILFTIGANLPVMVQSLFGTNTLADASVISWAGLSAAIGGDGVSEKFKTAVTAALTFIQIIGAIAFVRGWLILKKVVEGGSNASLAQGLTHLLGGVAAINIFQFLVVMEKTFGLSILN